VNPSKTFIANIGHDQSGTHCTRTTEYLSKLCMNKNLDFDIDISESVTAIEEVKNFYKNNKKNIFQRIINKFKLD
jgi:hypothetical protein